MVGTGSDEPIIIGAFFVMSVLRTFLRQYHIYIHTYIYVKFGDLCETDEPLKIFDYIGLFARNHLYIT